MQLDPTVWRRAVEQLLACPACRGNLSMDLFPESLVCGSCRRTLPIVDGVLDCLGDAPTGQDSETRGRDALASSYLGQPKDVVLNLIARHHCLAIMRHQIGAFISPFSQDDWVLDMGVGYGWHWDAHRSGPFVVGIDLSLPSLRVAQSLFGGAHPRMLLVRADVRRLPVRAGAVAGVWSVQMMQHVPEGSRQEIVAGVDRVLRDPGSVEVWNLNPARMLQGLYWLLRKNFVRHGSVGAMELHRLYPEEWQAVWAAFRPGRTNCRHRYSELFFHPDLRLTPARYPIGLERAITRYLPVVARSLARQSGLRLQSASVRV